MAVSQREVYLLPHPFDSRVEEHPFIVLSVQEANDYENTFVAAMITSSENRRDDFSFNLMDEIFESPLRKDKSHVRMHLLTLCLNEEIVGTRINKMKERYFREMMITIGELIFNYNFKPL